MTGEGTATRKERKQSTVSKSAYALHGRFTGSWTHCGLLFYGERTGRVSLPRVPPVTTGSFGQVIRDVVLCLVCSADTRKQWSRKGSLWPAAPYTPIASYEVATQQACFPSPVACRRQIGCPVFSGLKSYAPVKEIEIFHK